MVLRRVRNGLSWFFTALDSEGVGLFQGIVYVHVVLAGLYGLLVAQGVPQAVEDSMGPLMNKVWLGMCLGAVLCLLGKVTRGGLANVGLWLQVAGDIFVFGAFSSYVVATLTTSSWAKALFAVFVIAALADCAFLLVIRDVRRIGQVERAVRR